MREGSGTVSPAASEEVTPAAGADPLGSPGLDASAPPSTWTRRQRAELAVVLSEQLGTSEIARRLGVSPSTVRSYLADPDGGHARARWKARPRGRCKRCSRPTGAPRGKRAFALCALCAAAERASWTRADVLAAYLRWQTSFGRPPTSTDWSHTHARRRGGTALERFRSGRWPTPTVVARLFGGWPALRNAVRGSSAA
jgi:hypothetical protein